MRLKQSEIIQILRKRAGLNQAELGSRAFKTTPDSGRTKIKNIELGKQRACEDDLRRIAKCLDVSVEQLQPAPQNQNSTPVQYGGGVRISQKIVDMFPDLREYLEMLENASRIDDSDLIAYLFKKIADIWRDGPKLGSQSSTRIIATAEEKANRG